MWLGPALLGCGPQPIVFPKFTALPWFAAFPEFLEFPEFPDY